MALIFEPVDGHWLVFIGFLALVIIPSNAIVITTWNIRGKRKHISTLLSLVAVSDSCLLLVDFSHKCLEFIEVECNICKFSVIWWCFGMFFHSFSVFLTVYVAVQRSVVCAFPFNGPKIFRVKTSVIYLLIVTVCLIPQSFSPILLIKNVQTNAIFRKRDITHLCSYIWSTSTVWKISGNRSRSGVN